MAEKPRGLSVGCLVTVPATQFDGDEDPPWSEVEFGAMGATRQLPARVTGIRRGRIGIVVLYDDTTYNIEAGVLTHDPLTCPKCRPKNSSMVQGNPPEPAASLEPADHPSHAGAVEGADGTEDGGGTDSDEDLQPLHRLANRAAQATTPSPTATPTDSNHSLDSEDSLPVSGAPVSSRIASGPRRNGDTGKVVEQPVAEVALTDSSDSDANDSPYDEGETEESEDSGHHDGPGRASRGRGRGRGGSGRGGRRGPRTEAEKGHFENGDIISRHHQPWTKGAGRTIDPLVNGGYKDPPRFTLYNYCDKGELEFFSHCFPKDGFREIAQATTKLGRVKLKRPNWEATPGEMCCFLGLKLYMMIFPMQGPVEQFWEEDVVTEDIDQLVRVSHNVGRYGLSYNRYREIERSFALPTHGDKTDVFDPIRYFVKVWNENMEKAFVPGYVLTVDESMGLWKGKGMPGLMSVPRKPTPIGREAHTTACGETGVVIFYEVYEGKALMANKEFVSLAGKNPAKAMRCVKPWFRSGRLVILDSGFASVSAAVHLMDKGLYMIGNVKTADVKFPKAWLISQCPTRGNWATCTTTVTTPSGIKLELLAACDRDRQPMALLGSGGTSVAGQTLHRHFTTIRADGTYNVRSASLEQMHIHELYRRYFNALDRHNSIRQGGHCFEDSWRTNSWFVREFQMLWGISEVNAWILFKKFKPGKEDISFSTFRRTLCASLLKHPLWCEEKERQLRARLGSVHNIVPGDDHPLVHIGSRESGRPIQRTCVMCGKRTAFMCICVQMGQKPGLYLCNPAVRQCYALHKVPGASIPNKQSASAKKRWMAHKEVAQRGRGRPRTREP